MNERIEELYKQAWKESSKELEVNDPARYYSDKGPDIVMVFEKFAELIVQGCIKEIEFQYGGGNLMDDGVTHNPEWDNALECASAMIRQQFGLK